MFDSFLRGALTFDADTVSDPPKGSPMLFRFHQDVRREFSGSRSVEEQRVAYPDCGRLYLRTLTNATRCSCGQAFVVVFTERVDFRDGSDTQVELAVALWPAELEGLEGAFQPLTLTKLVRGRAFLVKSTGDAPRWVASGFSIGPHD